MRKNYVTMFSGANVFPRNLDPATLHARDAAHHLSMDCRFAGASRRFYSTAQHSVLCSLLVEKLFPNEPDAPKYALVHDIEEAVLRDMPKGIKELDELAGYKELGIALRSAWLQKLGLLPMLPDVVKVVDSRLGATEAVCFLNSVPEWVGTEGYEPYEGIEIFPMPAEAAEQMFIQRFVQLFGPALLEL